MATTENGALEFEAVMKNGKLIQAIDEAEKKVQGFADATTRSGEQIDKTFDITAENIKIQKDVIAGLEGDIRKLDDAIAGLHPGKAQNDLRYQANAARQELAAEKDALKMMEDQVNNTSNATVNFRTRIRHMRDELVMMEAAGKRNTEEYEKLRMEMANLVDAVGDATQQANILAHDQAAMQGIISGLTGIAGGFSAAQGAMSLFIGENEDLQKVMVKVQALMSITIGLQQVEQTLNKDSAFMVKTVGDLKRWWIGVQKAATAATTADTVAQTANTAAATAGTVANTGLAGSFRLVGAAIKSIPVFGWIAAGIGAIISAVAIMRSKSKKAREELQLAEEERKKAMEEEKAKIKELGDEYAEQRAEIESLRASMKSEKLSYDEKVGVINKLREIIPDYNAKLSKEGDVIMENKAALDKYMASLDKSLKYKAAMKDLQDIYSQMYVLDREGYGADPGSDEYTAARNKAKSKWFADRGMKETDYLGETGQKALDAFMASWDAGMEIRRGEYQKLVDQAKEITDYIVSNKLATGSGSKSGTGSDSTAVKEFKEELNAKKQQYDQFEKWMNSKDPILQKSAKTEFASLLKEGQTYIEYLQRQRSDLMAIADRTADQNDKLFAINNAIANEANESIISSFAAGLDEQLAVADTIIEKLEVIKEKRSELKNDGSPEDMAESEVLNDAEDDVIKQAKAEAAELVKSYELATDQRLSVEQNYQNKMTALREAYNREDSIVMKSKLRSAMDLLEKMHDAGIESFEDLAALNQDALAHLDDFESKRMQIVAYYEPLIAAARINGNEKAAKELEGKRDMEIVAESDQYQNFFNDIQDMSIRTFEATRRSLIGMVQQAFAAGKMTYDQYVKIIKKINDQADQAYQGRGMEQIFGSGKGGGVMNLIFGEGDMKTKIQQMKTVFAKPKDDMIATGEASAEVAGNAEDAAGAMSKAAGGAVGALGMVDAIITAVYQTIDATTSVMDTVADMQESFGKDTTGLRETTEMMGMINDTVMSGWQKLKSGDIMGALADTINLPMKIITLANKIHDRKIEDSIKRHQDAVGNLTKAYGELEQSIKHALGTDVYKYQQEAIENLERQKAEIDAMIADENSKKNTDDDRVKEMQDQVTDLEHQKEDALADLAREITQTDAKTFADQLGDALVDAFGRGEDAAGAFEDTVNSVMKNAVINMLKKQFLEKGLQKAIDNLENSMGYWNGDEFVFDGLTESEQESFRRQVESVGQGFTEAMKAYESLFKDAVGDEESLKGSGGIQSVSEQTATKIDGQMNAMRINQVESMAIMRQQLNYLAEIEYNTSFCKHAAKIDQIFDLMKNQSSSLRGYGLNL